MNIGEKHIVKIIDNDSNGNGIAKLHNFVIFVLYALKDEEVEIEIIDSSKRFAFAKIIKVIKQSKLRCDIKIENKRLKRAIKQKSDLLNLEADIEKLLIKNSTYLTDTFDAIEKNKKELEELLEELA